MNDDPDILEQPDDADNQSEQANAHTTSDELDANRIQRIARMRQALGRSRSHAIALAVVTAVLAAQLLFNLIRHLSSHGPTWRSAFYAIGAILLATITIFALRRARRLTHKLRQPMQPSLTTQPDFSPLSDGSQQWQNLDRM